MFYIIGLGNPGEEYITTRHNVGQLCVRHIRDTYSFPRMVTSAKYSGAFSIGTLAGAEVTLFFPDTYMNHSGSAVKKLCSAADKKSLIVIHDDVALPIGTFKVSQGKGSGGHNGVASIIDALGSSDFTRVRIGIAPVTLFGRVRRPEGALLSKFVLGSFSRGEQRKLEPVYKTVGEALEVIISTGVTAAMQQYNG